MKHNFTFDIRQFDTFLQNRPTDRQCQMHSIWFVLFIFAPCAWTKPKEIVFLAQNMNFREKKMKIMFIFIIHRIYFVSFLLILLLFFAFIFLKSEQYFSHSIKSTLYTYSHFFNWKINIIIQKTDFFPYILIDPRQRYLILSPHFLLFVRQDGICARFSIWCFFCMCWLR